MPVLKVLYQNHGLNKTWSASSKVATLPACHLGHENRQKVWRTTGLDTGTTGDWAKVNLGATGLAVGAIALVSANLSTNATITFEAATCDNFPGGASFTTSLTPWKSTGSGVMVHFLACALSCYPWWRFVLDDTGNSTGYIECGVVALGPVLSFETPQRLHYQIEDPSVVDYSPAGTPKTWELAAFVRTELPVRLVDEANVFGSIQTALRAMGRKKDVVLSLYSESPACSDPAKATNLYGRIADMPAWDYVIPSKYDATLRFQESL